MPCPARFASCSCRFWSRSSSIRASARFWPIPCLGNLLLAAAIYRHLRLKDSTRGSFALARQPNDLQQATIQGLADLARALGVQEDAVLPAALTPAELSLLYSNGVLSTSEDKSGAVRRFYPVDRIMTAFCGKAALHPWTRPPGRRPGRRD